MAKFCKYCGTNTEENTCDCAPAQPSQEESNQVTPESTINIEPKQETPVQVPNFNFDAEKANAAMNTAKETAGSSFNLAKNIFADMIGNIQKDPTKENTTLRLVIGGGHLVSVLLITFIAINLIMSMILGSYASMITIPFSSKVCIGIFLIISSSLYVLIPAAICYLVSKKYLPSQTFLNVVGVFSICTIPTTILYIVAALGSLIDTRVGMFFVSIAAIVYLIHSYEAVISTTKQNRNSGLMIFLVAICVTALAQYFVVEIGGEALANQIQNSMMKSMGW